MGVHFTILSTFKCFKTFVIKRQEKELRVSLPLYIQRLLALLVAHRGWLHHGLYVLCLCLPSFSLFFPV